MLDINFKEFLLSIGFEEIDRDLDDTDEDKVLSHYKLKYLISIERRQFYYLLVDFDGTVDLYSPGNGESSSPATLKREGFDIIYKIKKYRDEYLK